MLGLASGTTVATQPGWGRLSAKRLPSSRSSRSIPPQQCGNGPALPSLSFPAHGAFLRVPFPALGTNNHQHHCWAAPQPLQPPPNQQRAPKLSPTQGSAGGTPTKTTPGSAEAQHTPTPNKTPIPANPHLWAPLSACIQPCSLSGPKSCLSPAPPCPHPWVGAHKGTEFLHLLPRLPLGPISHWSHRPP